MVINVYVMMIFVHLKDLESVNRKLVPVTQMYVTVTLRNVLVMETSVVVILILEAHVHAMLVIAQVNRINAYVMHRNLHLLSNVGGKDARPLEEQWIFVLVIW